MLALSRKVNEEIMIGDLLLKVIGLNNNWVSFNLGEEYHVLRKNEILNVPFGIKIKCGRLDNRTVRFCFEAPKTVKILRKELYDKNQRKHLGSQRGN